MATVGQAYTTPDAGWQRIEENDVRIKYTGSWTNLSHGPASGGYLTYSGTSTGSIRFTFTGTKLRIVLQLSNIERATGDTIINIDGANYTYTEKAASSVIQALAFDKQDLPAGTHVAVITCPTAATSAWFNLDAIEIDSTASLLTMATVGQQLTAPGAGWKRIDTDAANIAEYFAVTGSWYTVSDVSYYGGSGWYPTAAGAGYTCSFKFKGTRFRLISYGDTRYPTNNIATIDGVQYTFSLANSSNFQSLAFEITGLENKLHTVKLTTGSNGNYQCMYVDAIDIGESDTMMYIDPFKGRWKSSVNSLTTLGEYVWCKYTAGTSLVGTFSELGIKTDAETSSAILPVTGAAYADGYFRCIFVGYDRKGNKKLVADRIIQSQISYDKLNVAGIASGEGLPVMLSGNKCTVRLMTSGMSPSDTNSEWDKIIVESTLGGIMTAGDNYGWNWSGTAYSLTSTRSSAAAVYGRGVSSAAAYNGITLNTVDATVYTGFRPMFLVEPGILATPKKATPTHVYTDNNPVDIELSIYEFDTLSSIQASVLVNGVEKQTGILVTSQDFTVSLPYTQLASGANIVTIKLASGAITGETSIQIFKEDNRRNTVTRTFTTLDGGYIKDNVSFDGSAKVRTKYTKQHYAQSTLGSGIVFKVLLDKYTDKVEVI